MNRPDQIRKEILFQAYATRPLPVSADRIRRNCQKEQLDFSLAEIVRELPFLAGEKLLEPYPMPGVTELHYVITSAGVRHYEQTYAA